MKVRPDLTRVTAGTLVYTLSSLVLCACGGGGGGSAEGPNPTYSISGTISGLSGGSITLQNNGGDAVSANVNGAFQFANKLTSGSSYGVSISRQPTNQSCNVSNATGVISGVDVANISVTCVFATGIVGGIVSGLNSSGLALNLNGAVISSGNGNFSFAPPLNLGAKYNVLVDAQPSGPESCIVSNGMGTISATAPVNVTISCSVAPPLSVHISDLDANDIAAGPDGKLYLAIASTSKIAPNTVATLDPITGTLEQSVFAGSEPAALSVSDDGKYLYVGFLGTQTAKRLLLPSLSTDISIPIGQFDVFNHHSADPQFATQIAAAPGASRTFALLELDPQGSSEQGNLFAFDDDVQRGTFALGGPAGTAFQWGADAGTIYAANGAISSLDLLVYSVPKTGMQLRTYFPGALPYFNSDITFGNGLIYTDLARVIDTSTGKSVGDFPFRGPVAIDAKSKRAYLPLYDNHSNLTIHAFDSQSLAELSVAKIPSGIGVPRKIIRWGTDGLAILPLTRQLVLLSGAFVASGGSGDTKPVTSPTAPVPEVTPAQTTVVTKANDAIWDAGRGLLYVSLSASATTHGNSIASVDPVSGQIASFLDLSFTPGALAISQDGQYLYVASTTDDSIRRFHLPQLSADVSIPLDSAILKSGNIVVAPGAPRTIAISFDGVSRNLVYDDAVLRTSLIGIEGGWVEWGNSPTQLYSFDNNSTAFKILEYDFSANTPTVANATPMAFSTNFYFPFNTTFKAIGGLVYSDTGSVWNPQTRSIVGIFPLRTPGKVQVDLAHNRVYFALGNEVEIFDATRYTAVLHAYYFQSANTIKRFLQMTVSSLVFVTDTGDVVVMKDSILAQ